MKLLIDLGIDPVKIGLDFLLKKVYHVGKGIYEKQKLKKQQIPQQQMYVQQQIPQQQQYYYR